MIRSILYLLALYVASINKTSYVVVLENFFEKTTLQRTVVECYVYHLSIQCVYQLPFLWKLDHKGLYRGQRAFVVFASELHAHLYTSFGLTNRFFFICVCHSNNLLTTSSNTSLRNNEVPLIVSVPYRTVRANCR